MDNWDAKRMLDRHILDYMIKKGMHKTAEIFAREAHVAPDDVVINPPDAFLREWWSIFWDIFSSRQPENEEAAKATGNEAQNSGPIPPRLEMNPQAFGSMLLPQMDQQTMSVMQPPARNPAMNQRTVTVLQPRIPNPALNQHAMSVMQPPRSIPNPTTNQAKLPEALQREPVSILLGTRYEQESLRRSATDLAGNLQQLDVTKMNPMLASSSKYSYPPQQNAGNVQPWLGGNDRRAIGFERLNRLEASQSILRDSEIPHAGKNKEVQKIPARGHRMAGVGFSSGLWNQVPYTFVSMQNQQQQFPPCGGHNMTGVGLVSPGLGNQVSHSLVSLPNQQQQFAPAQWHYQVDTLPTLAVQKSENQIPSASGSSHDPATPMLIDGFSGNDLEIN